MRKAGRRKNGPSSRAAFWGRRTRRVSDGPRNLCHVFPSSFPVKNTVEDQAIRFERLYSVLLDSTPQFRRQNNKIVSQRIIVAIIHVAVMCYRLLNSRLAFAGLAVGGSRRYFSYHRLPACFLLIFHFSWWVSSASFEYLILTLMLLFLSKSCISVKH